MLPLWTGPIVRRFCHNHRPDAGLHNHRPDAGPMREARICMLKRRKIVVIVDDDPSMLKATEHLLDAHGFETKVFASAEEFLDRRAATNADCLLLDIHLGGMSGIELRRQLKASG